MSLILLYPYSLSSVMYTLMSRPLVPLWFKPQAVCRLRRVCSQAYDVAQYSEGRTIRLETLIELKFLDSSFSSSNSSIRLVRAYPLIDIRQSAPGRAIRADSISVNSTLPPSYVCTLMMMPYSSSSVRQVVTPKAD